MVEISVQVGNQEQVIVFWMNTLMLHHKRLALDGMKAMVLGIWQLDSH
jgi:hypothetical protein